MQWAMGQGGSGGGNPDVIAQVYKTLVGQKRLSNYGTDFVGSTSGTTTYGVYIVRNFTVNSGVTVTMGGTASTPAIIICDTLTVNGVLNAGNYQGGGASSNGSGIGGAGGRALYIFARQIVGTGTIASNGVSGGNGAASTLSNSYSSGTSGYYAYLPFGNGGTPGAGSYGTTLTAAVAGTPVIGASGLGTVSEMLLRFPTWFMGGTNVFNATSYNWVTGNSWGGCGASGASGNYTTTAYMYGGGAGGGSAIASGGNGGTPAGTTTGSVTGGGGGGGAGHLYIFTESPFPSMNLQVAGGIGGNSYGVAGGGGGGAGGYIGLWCPTGSPASTVVTGGAAGTNSAGGGTAPTAGGAGDFDQFVFAA